MTRNKRHEHRKMASRSHRVARALLTNIDSLLIDLAGNKDPERNRLHGADNELHEKIAAYGRALEQHGNEPAERGCTETTHFKLLLAKKRILQDIVAIIESLERAVAGGGDKPI